MLVSYIGYETRKRYISLHETNPVSPHGEMTSGGIWYRREDGAVRWSTIPDGVVLPVIRKPSK